MTKPITDASQENLDTFVITPLLSYTGDGTVTEFHWLLSSSIASDFVRTESPESVTIRIELLER